MALIIAGGSPSDRAAIQLATRKDRYIPNERRKPRPSVSMHDAWEWVRRDHPNCKLRCLSSSYNCVGMVFASRRTWVDTDHVPMILDDDGYQRIAEKDVAPGDVVVYRDERGECTHVGIVVEHEPVVENASWKTMVLSQWGGDGEYIHALMDVNPKLGTKAEFYREQE